MFTSRNLFLMCGCDVTVCEVLKHLRGIQSIFVCPINMLMRAWHGQFSVLSSRAARLLHVVVHGSLAVQFSTSPPRPRG